MASKFHLADLAFQATRPLLKVPRAEVIGAWSSRIEELVRSSAAGGGILVRGFSTGTVPTSGHKSGVGGNGNAASNNNNTDSSSNNSSNSSSHRRPKTAFREDDHATAETRAEEYADDDEYDEEQRNSQRDRDRALGRILRSSNAAEQLHSFMLSAVHFFRGYSQALHGRVDAQFFEAQEVEAAEGVRQLLPKYRVRPSLVQGPLSLVSVALGAVAAAAPQQLGLAVVGAVGDALSEHYNEQLRQLNEAGAAQEAPDVRHTLRSLRDLARIPEGAPPAPDLISVLQEGVAAAAASSSGSGGAPAAAASSLLSGMAAAAREWGLEGTAGALVKAGARVALQAAARY
ncbi:hypothetical protein VOLCADRAFT_107843 [Volvox carteri f. nagariensis]|uniref:Ubiquinone biosynthesis protein n=1 Tax=Volvox carteri f. nagariensis TaxID=3068 RepID=D8UGT2_VOLCA|nr:uncharacterized protein VOLCADRAFT_107843 [Volvox carteri f. nagariensis]EFJ41081.1 hypothetical protein VOLCADRAFT_107843 [Volvox carteri f. nagariensis]|eukprot:XP_002957844.1 hypothetical protein VOLCADRAFT_107843 [Volvox carteri f. nagariensis]